VARETAGCIVTAKISI